MLESIERNAIRKDDIIQFIDKRVAQEKHSHARDTDA
jgi:hypothetical protein